MSHGINANVVRRWLPLFRDQQAVVLPAFVPVNVAPVNSKPKAQASAVIELPFGEQTITVKSAWASGNDLHNQRKKLVKSQAAVLAHVGLCEPECVSV